MNGRVLLLLLLPILASCGDGDVTYAVVHDDVAGAAVYKAWYRTTLFVEGIAPGNDTPVHRVAPGGDLAYALLAPGWDPHSDAGAPAKLVAVQTSAPVSVRKGDVARIVLAADTVRGACLGSSPLSRDEYAVLTDRIFPGDALPTFDEACRP
jgi:hypothetical protein